MDPAVDQAYRAMQTAERQKDQDPRAYREAKVKYQRLAQGEKWMQTERKRVLQEAKTHTRKWLSEQDFLKSQQDSQRKNLELVRAAEGGTLGLQDDVQQAVEQLKKMVTREKDRKNVDERLAQWATTPGGSWAPPSWLLTALDFLIVGLLGQICQVVYKVQYRPGPAATPSFLSGT